MRDLPLSQRRGIKTWQRDSSWTAIEVQAPVDAVSRALAAFPLPAFNRATRSHCHFSFGSRASSRPIGSGNSTVSNSVIGSTWVTWPSRMNTAGSAYSLVSPRMWKVSR